MKVSTGIRAGIEIPRPAVYIEKAAGRVANLVNGQNAYVIDWAKSMHEKSNQLWSALTGQ